jgi:hypothetical protein
MQSHCSAARTGVTQAKDKQQTTGLVCKLLEGRDLCSSCISTSTQQGVQ